MERFIRVTGKGSISVAPDTIKLHITAEGVSKEYEKAVEKSAEETALIREAISRAGIDPKELKTNWFNVDSAYERYRDKNDDLKSKFVGYRYEHRMNVMFPNDNAILGKVLYELANCPVNVEFSITHTVKDTEPVKNELIRKAVMDSKVKAENLTKAAGVELGDVVTIDYSWGKMEIHSRNMDMMALKCAIEPCESIGYDIDIEAEDINVEDTVTVVWEIK